MTERDEESVPVSVRLGAVVPPEDPEDWTRPLTWIAAAGMLAAPIATLAWFAVAPPGTAAALTVVTYSVAVILAVGAAGTGSTQQGVARAWTGTVAAGLFGALVMIVIGAALAGERQVGAASPTLAHAFAAAAGGLAGSVAAAIVAAPLAGVRGRSRRFVPAAVVGAAAALAVTRLLG